MINVALFNIGQRGAKWHAVWEADGESMEGPARDTRAEAEADRDHAIHLFKRIMSKTMPGAKLTASKIQ
jgi:hypothetical protein